MSLRIPSGAMVVTCEPLTDGQLSQLPTILSMDRVQRVLSRLQSLSPGGGAQAPCSNPTFFLHWFFVPRCSEGWNALIPTKEMRTALPLDMRLSRSTKS